MTGAGVPAGLPHVLHLPTGAVPLEIGVNRRARRMSLRLCPARRVARLTLPPRTGRARALDFLDRNRGWLMDQARRRLLPAIAFQPGATLPVAGRDLHLDMGAGRFVQQQDDRLLVPGTGEVYAGRVRRWLKQEALTLLEAETRELATMAGRPVAAVRVGDFSSRWGSCSADGRIAYSWRLLLAPEFVRRSVVAHEVAHLVEMNHGPRFWALATELLGTCHDAARQWLRAHAPELMRYGVSVAAADQEAARASATASFSAS